MKKALIVVMWALHVWGCGDHYSYPDALPTQSRVYIDAPLAQEVERAWQEVYSAMSQGFGLLDVALCEGRAEAPLSTMDASSASSQEKAPAEVACVALSTPCHQQMAKSWLSRQNPRTLGSSPVRWWPELLEVQAKEYDWGFALLAQAREGGVLAGLDALEAACNQGESPLVRWHEEGRPKLVVDPVGSRRLVDEQAGRAGFYSPQPATEARRRALAGVLVSDCEQLRAHYETMLVGLTRDGLYLRQRDDGQCNPSSLRSPVLDLLIAQRLGR